MSEWISVESKEKQIEEMANIINEMPEPNGHYYDEILQAHEAFADCFTIARCLIEEKGYRKASEVALEVIGEVVLKAKAIFCPDCDYDVSDIRYNLDWLEAELKKKYMEEGK